MGYIGRCYMGYIGRTYGKMLTGKDVFRAIDGVHGTGQDF